MDNSSLPPSDPNIVVRLASSDDEWIGASGETPSTQSDSAAQTGATADQSVRDARKHQQSGDLDLAARAGLAEVLMAAN